MYPVGQRKFEKSPQYFGLVISVLDKIMKKAKLVGTAQPRGVEDFMPFHDERWAYEMERRRYRQVDPQWSTDLVITIFASIFGFAILFGVMVYISSASH
jgi:hypothetical protein